MDHSRMHVLIMAGGGGTRFWPRSRQKLPKQFLQLAGERSLLQQALDRVEALAPVERIWVITSASQRELVAEHLPQLPASQIIAEPCGRDTAACIGLGAALIAAHDPNAVMVAMPSDHVIEPAQPFRTALLAAVQLAEEAPDALITFGVSPTFPATGYGYIHRGAERTGPNGIAVAEIRAFREKPDSDTAERYFTSGEYLWNSGIFVWKAKTLLGELERQRPNILQAVQRIATAFGTPEYENAFRTEYEPLHRVSIDYAVMEGCRRGLVIPAPFRWDDVGSWQAVERMHPQDADGNTILGKHLGLKTRNCIVVGDADRLIATAGIDSLVIVQDGNATLVANKEDEAAVKKLVELLKQKGWEQYL